MASGFTFPSVPWYRTNAAKFAGNVGLGPLPLAVTPNCSHKCNCKAGFEPLMDRSKCAESDDSSGAEVQRCCTEVRRCCDRSSSSATGYPWAGDLAKCSDTSDTGTLPASVLKASNSTGPRICCEEQRPGLDANIAITSRQNPPNSAVHSLSGGRTGPKLGSESKTRNPTRNLSLEFEPCSIGDAYYPKMLSKSFQDLDAGYLSAKNREPEVQIYSKALAAFSDCINESHLQEGYGSGLGKDDNNKTQKDGKVSKRKAGEMETKAVAVEAQSRNVLQRSRIVRISRLAGYKDRHSKVLTIKGIRDRRIRLSVPTAIQFYDLQDRLGFEQPSKAVDWLIDISKSAIDELPVLDAEMAASASAGNVINLIPSNTSGVEHCVASPRESATAAAASAFRFGPGSLEREWTSSRKAMEDSDMGRSNSSTSDGSIKESAEHYTSKSLMWKPCSRIDARFKETERPKKKSVFAKISGKSPSAIRQLKSRLHPAFFPSVPVESQCIKDDKEGEIHAQAISGTGSARPLWDSNVPSYTGILFTSQDSHPPQNMGTLGSPTIQNCFPPETIQALNLQIDEDTVLAFSDPKKSGHWEDNSAQSQDNLFYSNINMNIMKILDQQQQQESDTHIYENFASTIFPTLSNDINFSTSSLSSPGPLQSNSSASITNMPYLPDSEDCLW